MVEIISLIAGTLFALLLVVFNKRAARHIIDYQREAFGIDQDPQFVRFMAVLCGSIIALGFASKLYGIIVGG